MLHKQKINEMRVRDAIGEEGAPEGSAQDPESVDQEPPKYGYAQIRDAITERLGGPFDYTGFTEELRELTADLPKLSREFKADAERFAAPDLRDGFQRVPPYKFTLPEFDDSSIFTVDPIFGAQPGSK